MGFEKIVLDKVAKVLKQDRQAYFVNGTLFVSATLDQSFEVLSMLNAYYNGKVQTSRVGANGEFAYDFVA
jgi:hypothetical protein